MTPVLPTSLVLDSSIIIKWFRPQETLASEALALRQAYLDGAIDIAVPDLLIYEVANVLRYQGELPLEQIQAAVQSIFDLELEVISVSPMTINRAIDIALTYEATVYDAYFVALAGDLEADFVTADEKLARSLEKLAHVHFLGDISL